MWKRRLSRLSIFLDVYSSLRTYPFNREYDKVLKDALKSGIEYLKYGYLDFDVRFGNGVRGERLWNANKYYAWLTGGSLGETYYKGMPSKKAMYRLQVAMKEYVEDQKILLETQIALIQFGDEIIFNYGYSRLEVVDVLKDEILVTIRNSVNSCPISKLSLHLDDNNRLATSDRNIRKILY